MDEPIRVLVVDDDFATRLLACEALLADGFQPFEACDGREALEQFDRVRPDAILLDINMPELDGYEVCRRIRRRPGGGAVSVLVMTATDDIDAVEQAFAAGATDFLTKPLNLPLLAHRVRYMLRAANATAAARDAANQLARAQRIARVVHWQIDPSEQFAWACDPLEVFWPDGPEERRFEHLLTWVHPEDRDRVAAALASRAPHELVFRLQFPDGSERIVQQDAELDFTDRGIVLIGATQDVTETKQAEQQILQLALYDDLTGLPNRQFVERYLRRADLATPRWAIAVDLGTGHLDRLSPTTRDQLLRAATARVIERVRNGDLDVRLDPAPRPVEAFTSRVLVARTDDDELTVITSDLSDGAATSLARRVADALGPGIAIAGNDYALRPRFGVVEYPDPIGDLRRLDDYARQSMHDAERTAPRDIVAFTAHAKERRARRANLADLLALALDTAPIESSPMLCATYAPRVDARQRVLGVRARPLWNDGCQDAQTLHEALAADPALRARLAMWTLEEACRDAACWREAGAALRVAVELPCECVAARGFAARFDRLLDDAGLHAALFDLELVDPPTDREELERLATALEALRPRGVHFALAQLGDDTSIGQLRRLPLDTVRLDRATIERLGAELVAGVAAIARALRLRLAVIGIDAPAALAALDPHEADELSGQLFGAPLSADAVPGLVAALIPTSSDAQAAALVD